MFPRGDRNLPAAKCKITGVTCHDEPRPLAREAGPPPRRAPDARRGLRHRRSERRQEAARGARRVAAPIAMICAKCKTENPKGLKFCIECGAAFETLCSACGFGNL